MGQARVESGRLLIRRPETSIGNMECFINIRAPSGKRVVFKFQFFDVRSPQGCHDDHMAIFDSYHQKQIPKSGRLCNKENVPDRAYVSSGEEASVALVKTQYLSDQVELIFTAFRYP